MASLYVSLDWLIFCSYLTFLQTSNHIPHWSQLAYTHFSHLTIVLQRGGQLNSLVSGYIF